MECLQARVASFSKSKREKKGSSTTTLKWPHPTSSSSFGATPTTLAEAGFYFSPSTDDPDNVICFMCAKELSGWEAEDDPFQIHYDKCKTSCPWALLRCGLRDDMDRHGRFVFTHKSRLPTSKAMEKARVATFAAGSGWIHDTVSGHGASSKKLAKAGFVYTPQEPGDDLATCLYCNVSLSGWEEDDDPMEEHRKRKDNEGYGCPFFPDAPLSVATTSSTSMPSSTLRTKPPSRSTKPASRSQSQQVEDTFMPTKTHDGDPFSDNETGGEASESGRSNKSTKSRKSTATGKTPRKASTRKASSAAKTPAGRSASRSSNRSALKDVVEENEDREEEVEVEVELKKKKSTAKTAKAKGGKRGRSQSVAPLETDSEVPTEDVEHDIEPLPTVKKSSRTMSRSIAAKKGSRSQSVPQSEVEDAEEKIIPKAEATKKIKAKSTKNKPVEDVASVADSDMELDNVDAYDTAPETERKPSKTTRKSRAPSRSKKVAREQENDADELDLVDDVDEDLQKTAKKPRLKAKASGSKAKPPKTKGKATQVAESEQDEDPLSESLHEESEEPEVPTVKRSARAKVTKPGSKSKATDKGKGKAASKLPASSQKPIEEEKEEDDHLATTEQEQTQDEDEFGPVIPQPSFTTGVPAKEKNQAAAAAVGKGKPPSRIVKQNSVGDESLVHPQDDSDVPQPPPPKLTVSKPGSKFSPPVMMSVDHDDCEEDMELTPLVIPKRSIVPVAISEPSNTKAETEVTKPIQKESKVKKEMKVVDVSSDEEQEQGQEARDEELRATIKLIPSKHPFVASSEKPKPSKQSLPMLQPIEVDGDIDMNIDDDELDEQEIQDQFDVPMQDSQDSKHTEEPPKSPLRLQTLQTPTIFQAPSSSSVFGGLGPPSSALGDPSSSQSAPPTSNQATQIISEAQESENPPVLPPLSKLPFQLMSSLTPAELGMTVEEWVRYQMEMEYDKFKRDGERELVRFRQKAEDVRKIIEGL